GYKLKPLPVPDQAIPIMTRAPSGRHQQPHNETGSLGAVQQQPAQPSQPQPSAQPVSSGPPSQKPSSGRPSPSCPHCGAGNPSGNRFCGTCGGRLPDVVESAPAPAPAAVAPPEQPVSAQAPDVFLVCINEDGTDGARIPLSTESILGRSTDQRFASDPFLSPEHAVLRVTGAGIEIEDKQSLNGTFVRIRGSVILHEGSCFLMGRQVLRLESFPHKINPKQVDSEGTRFMGSPIPGGSFKLVQIGIGGVEQNAYCLPAGGAVLGRERGDITFPGDKFMSARHAQVTTDGDGRVSLADMNSSNGTWIRIQGPHKLTDQDFIFLGQQLFRVQVSGT
ncbi:MAG: FHA domain-containing protein, partial [Myxococcales bacterium]|nr:FHA domain-containing protein [Myxococcales bacterium]